VNYGGIAKDPKWDEKPWFVRKLKDKYWGKLKPLDLSNRIMKLNSESTVKRILTDSSEKSCEAK